MASDTVVVVQLVMHSLRYLRKGEEEVHRASQFSRYLLERTGIPDRDKNARLNPVKLIKYSMDRAFLALFKRSELRCPEEVHRASQFSRYLLERTGIPDRDKNARLNPVKLIKYSRVGAFLAPF